LLTVQSAVSGAISYHGKSKAMFTTHPIEKPYYIFQIGSADPALAVQAARVVQDDVAGIDLNCGCPKPFSTHAGMGAALLSTPDLLCDILRALRAALPPRISLSAKIRLLPNQADTLKLVEQIIGTGVNALTVHCRTRNQRMREPAVIHRLQEIVHFVEGLGKGTAVIANGDCQNFEDAKRVKEISRKPFPRFRSIIIEANPVDAHSVMIATAAESNPTVFSPTPLIDVERTLIPAYIRLVSRSLIVSPILALMLA
jgi:tRNA-dihydrouridine synthase 2